jgi:hypothetical protein
VEGGEGATCNADKKRILKRFVLQAEGGSEGQGIKTNAARPDGDAVEDRLEPEPKLHASESEAQQGITTGGMAEAAEACRQLNPLGGSRVGQAGCREWRGMSDKWWWCTGGGLAYRESLATLSNAYLQSYL